MWYIHKTKYYSAIKKNAVLLHATTWRNHENTVLNDEASHWRPHVKWFNLYEMFRIGKTVEAVTVRVYFWALNSIPLTHVPVLMSAPYCLGYCRFVVSFETRKFKSSNFVLFSRLFWIFCIPCISTWVLRSVCHFRKRKENPS